MKTKLVITTFLFLIFVTRIKSQCSTTGFPATEVFSLGNYTVAPNSSFVARQICSFATVYDTLGGGAQRMYYLMSNASLYLKNVGTTTQVWMWGNGFLKVIQQGTPWIIVNQSASCVTQGTFYPPVTNCGSVSFPTVSCVSGIDEITNSDLISIYPNPTNEILTIDLNGDFQIIISNIFGQVILNETLQIGKNDISIQNQARGIYFYKLIGTKSYTGKLIKQ